jgi:hypothetical protein
MYNCLGNSFFLSRNLTSKRNSGCNLYLILAPASAPLLREESTAMVTAVGESPTLLNTGGNNV